MIDIRELRIGNFVSDKNSSDDIIVLIAEQIFSASLNATLFYPVRLTEERLFKFGFDKIDGDIFELNEYKEDNLALCYCRLRLAKRIDGSFAWIEPGFMRPFYHVHDLQNFYYARWGEELTIKEGV